MGSPYFPSCLKVDELNKVGASSDEEREPWDTPFNRATNAYKDRPLDKAPTSSGRISGFGCSMKVAEYYSSDAKSRKHRRKSTKADSGEVEQLKAEVELLKKRLDEKAEPEPAVVNQLVDERIRQIIPPAFIEGFAAWEAGGRQGPIHLPSYAGSNSSHQVSPPLLTPPQPALNTSTPPSAAALDRPAAGTGAPVSTLAELDALDRKSVV